MATYAFIDDDNIVQSVIVGKDENDHSCREIGFNTWEEYYQSTSTLKCKRTSFSHSFRKQFARIGFIYLEDRDVFVAPKPYPSWSLNNDSFWVAPVPRPDGVTPIVEFYGNLEEIKKSNPKGLMPSPWVWNENTLSWDLIIPDYDHVPIDTDGSAHFLDENGNIMHKNSDGEIVPV